MTVPLDQLPKHLRDDYRDLCMLKDCLDGYNTKAIAMAWGCSPRTANKHIQLAASEMMRLIFEQTQGDPEHPSTGRWTVEEFTADPRACLVLMTNHQLDALRQHFPGLNDMKKSPHITEVQK